MKNRIIFVITIVITVMISRFVIGTYDNYVLRENMKEKLMNAYHERVEVNIDER